MSVDPAASEAPDEQPPAPRVVDDPVGARGLRQQVLRRLLRDRRFVILAVYLVLLVGAFVGPYPYPHSYAELDLAHKSAPPGTPGHPLGTQELGRDLLAMINVACSTRP